ncbi:hypothetical protein AMTR_s00013p00262850 [Amborella trichopoda]|uniref:Cytochrome P450 n=1 Tax=Amborella trichopoda TaxID=13333 RepID=W1PQM6_AMBTC|nr:hypothetical protein AMTR_s00013p00262850 [Amborella trichopoda]
MEGVLLLCFALLVLWIALKIGYAIWWRPRALGKHLEKQGIRGLPYKILFGNVKDSNKLTREAYSRPIELSYRIVPQVIPFFVQTVKAYGKLCVTWFGRTPRVIVMEPELVKEVLSNKFGHFEKPPPTPLTKLSLLGLAVAEGEKWARHRRILNPAFHMEKLKGMVPEFILSCKEMIARWGKLVGEEGSCEIDVFPELQALTADVISRTAFGSSYEEGKRLFQLQQEQPDLVMQAIRNIYIPGFRFLPTEKNIRRKKIAKEVRAILQNLVQRREKAIKSGANNNHDLFGLLLESNNTNDNKSKMTLDDVVEECKLFLLCWTRDHIDVIDVDNGRTVHAPYVAATCERGGHANYRIKNQFTHS